MTVVVDRGTVEVALGWQVVEAYNLRFRAHDEAVEQAVQGNARRAAYLNWCAEDLEPRLFQQSFPGLAVR